MTEQIDDLIINISDEPAYEKAVESLEKIVARLESGDVTLDESLKLFQAGMKLTAYCNSRLQAMEEQITKLVVQSDQKVKEAPFDDV